jgi:hypothetical protein
VAIRRTWLPTASSLITSQDLATFELMECNLVTGVPRSVATLLPPNLQTLRIQYVSRDINRRHLFKVCAMERRKAPPSHIANRTRLDARHMLWPWGMTTSQQDVCHLLLTAIAW